MFSTKKVLFVALTVGATCAGAGSTLADSYEWDGSESRLWNVPGNWTPSGVPNSATDDVVIPNVSNDPIMNMSAIVRDITLASGATLDFAASSSHTLTVKEDFTLQGSGLTLTNAANEVIFDTASSRLLVDGSSLNATITGPGMIQLANASATIEIPSGNTLTSSGVTIHGQGEFDGSGTFANTGLVYADAGVIAMMSSLNISDGSTANAPRWQVADVSGYNITFKRTPNASLKGRFSHDGPDSTFQFDVADVVTEGKVYVGPDPVDICDDAQLGFANGGSLLFVNSSGIQLPAACQ